MHRVKLLQHFGVIPVLVFDGDTLPAKKHTEASRFKLILLNFLFFFFFFFKFLIFSNKIDLEWNINKKD